MLQERWARATAEIFPNNILSYKEVSTGNPTNTPRVFHVEATGFWFIRFPAPDPHIRPRAPGLHTMFTSLNLI